MVAGYVLRTVAICILSFIPAKDIELYLSVLIFLSGAILFGGLVTGFDFFPLSLYVGAGSIIMTLCINFELAYIPLLVRVLCILIYIATAVIYYFINDQKKWFYIYQFELLERAKWFLYIFLVAFLLDIIDTAGYNRPFYLLFILPILILMGLVYFIGKKKLSTKLFFSLYTVSLVCLSLYNYKAYGEFYRNFGYMLIVPAVFMLSHQL